MTTKKLAKITMGGIVDPICRKCKIEMYAVTEIILGGKNKHFFQCPNCNGKIKVGA